MQTTLSSGKRENSAQIKKRRTQAHGSVRPITKEKTTQTTVLLHLCKKKMTAEAIAPTVTNYVIMLAVASTFVDSL